MSDDIVKDAIHRSLSKKEPPRKRFNPLLLLTILLAAALIAALLGLFFEHRSAQSSLTAAEAVHQQELSRLKAGHEAQLAALQEQQDELTKEAERTSRLLESTQQELDLLTLRYQTLYAQAEGVRMAEFIIQLHEEGHSDLAAKTLCSMASSGRQYYLSQSMYTVPNRSGMLEAVFVYSNRVRLLEVGEQLLSQGLISGQELDWVQNLFEYHHITEDGDIPPAPDQ